MKSKVLSLFFSLALRFLLQNRFVIARRGNRGERFARGNGRCTRASFDTHARNVRARFPREPVDTFTPTTYDRTSFYASLLAGIRPTTTTTTMTAAAAAAAAT